MDQQDARQWVIDGMRACTPKDCPLPFDAVVSAKFAKNKKAVAIAEVRMFDGLPGTLEVSQTSLGKIFVGWNLSMKSLLNGNDPVQERYEDIPKSWCMRWLELPGGPIKWNATEWERVHKSSKPQQLELNLSA